MENNSKTLIDDLLELGFSRRKIAMISGLTTGQVAGVRLGLVELTKQAAKKLRGLRRWAQAMRADEDFSIKPGAYYEEQIIILPFNGGKRHTTLAQLYETNAISATQMIKLTRRLPYLYDYNAFIDEFPDQADINLDGEDEAQLILHHGLPEVEFSPGAKRENKDAVKTAITTLEEHQKEN